MKTGYRPDVDGLRAVAVLSVLFFHGGFELFRGGFVGVDVFFVISGYLITTIILEDLYRGRFSISTFYERRIKRIFPALFSVITFTLVVGLWLLTPTDLAELGESAAAAALFFSNMLFWSEAGYFDAPAHYKPLLHTWSLAVEEQFYLVFPLTLIAIRRWFRSQYLVCFVLAGIGSFLVSLIATRYFPTSAFYWAPMRAWELLVGAVLALGVLPLAESRGAREVMSAVGLTLVLGSFAVISPETPFPGVAGIAPVLGTALLIHSGRGGGSLVTDALSCRACVFVGLISYSLYLWHWPMLVFSRYIVIRELHVSEVSAVLVLSFLLAVLSWKFIEMPVRRRKFPRAKRLFVTAMSGIIFVATLGYWIHRSDGIPSRIEADQFQVLITNDQAWDRWEDCRRLPDPALSNGGMCTIGARESSEFLLWGDSHVHALASAIDRAADDNGLGGIVAIKDACPPLIGIDRPHNQACANFNDAVIEYLKQAQELETVFLVARWALSAEGSRYKREGGKPVRLVDRLGDGSREENNVVFERGLRRTIATLTRLGLNIVLVSQIPEVGYHVPTAFHVARLTGRDVNEIVAPKTQEYLDRNVAVSEIFETLVDAELVTLIEPWRSLCIRGTCRIGDDTGPFYRDDDHLSILGAQAIADHFDEAFRTLDET